MTYLCVPTNANTYSDLIGAVSDKIASVLRWYVNINTIIRVDQTNELKKAYV